MLHIGGQQSAAMGHEEVLVEIHFYDVDGVCIGRMRQWADHRDPGCDRLFKTPPEAVCFRVCSANNYSVNVFDRATQAYCPRNHALASVSTADCESAVSIEDPEDFSVDGDSSDSDSEADTT